MTLVEFMARVPKTNTARVLAVLYYSRIYDHLLEMTPREIKASLKVARIIKYSRIDVSGALSRNKFFVNRTHGGRWHITESGMQHMRNLLGTDSEETRPMESIDIQVNAEPERASSSRKVFIVHGHDDGTKETVARYLGQLDIEAIILHEQVSSSRTIIEKIEAYSDVDFAVILLTPDDMGASNADAAKKKFSPRARENVIFELGYFMAKLGRDKVCALKKGNVGKPGDVDGLVYISMENDWKSALADELDAAGIEIDMNKTLKKGAKKSKK